MNIWGLFFLVVTHFLSGRGLLGIFKIRQKAITIFSLSMITGVMISSLIPMFMQLLYIPITASTVAIAICIVSMLLNITQIRKYDYSVFNYKNFNISFNLYEVFFIALFICLLVPSVWRCFYYPPNARDILSGPEALAEFTVREHTMINSIFSVNLESTNNHLKPPFVADLQIIYKLFVHPFGQLWLSVMVISFLAWLYVLLREKLHPLLTGMFMLLFISIPDPYGYTYIILFDYCNMILFFAGVYFLASYLETRKNNVFYFSCMMFAFATFIRFDTLVLIAMLVPLLLFFFIKTKASIVKAIVQTLVFIALPYFFYFIWLNIFVKHYMPLSFDVSTQINHNLKDTSVFFQRFREMTTTLVFGGNNLLLFGWTFYVFAAILLLDVLFIRRFNSEARTLLYAMLVVYTGLPLLGYLIPWFDLNNTTKRGLFKLLPLIILYFRNSGIFSKLSEKIYAFENAMPKVKITEVQANHAIPGPKQKKKN